jgi:hypothetical protein
VLAVLLLLRSRRVTWLASPPISTCTTAEVLRQLVVRRTAVGPTKQFLGSCDVNIPGNSSVSLSAVATWSTSTLRAEGDCPVGDPNPTDKSWLQPPWAV